MQKSFGRLISKDYRCSYHWSEKTRLIIVLSGLLLQRINLEMSGKSWWNIEPIVSQANSELKLDHKQSGSDNFIRHLIYYCVVKYFAPKINDSTYTRPHKIHAMVLFCNHSTMYNPRSCKRSETLFQISLLLFLTWREFFYSQPTHFSSQPKK